MKQELIEGAQDLTKIIDFIRWGAEEFEKAELYYGHGTDNAWDEAVFLVLAVLDLPHDLQEERAEAELDSKQRQQVTNIILERIEKRTPAPYLVNRAWFAGVPFYVDERVLIPRSPFAELIANHFAPWLSDKPENLLEIGTGSGCMAIACAYAFPETNIIAADISADAIEVANRNVKEHGLLEQVEVINSDIYSNVPKKKFDIIISNPPYVGADEMTELPDEYQQEPNSALQAEDNGLQLVIRILKDAENYLTADGVLIVEVGNSMEALQQRFPQVDFLWLDFENGGDGVFLLTARQLQEYKNVWK